jgi:hypothetical protein
VQHLRVSRAIGHAARRTAARIAELSTIDLYLDAKSLLPLATVSTTTPHSSSPVFNPTIARRISNEIRFSDYRVVEGVQVPFHIQKLVEGTPVLDLTVSEVKLNAGIPSSEFITN